MFGVRSFFREAEHIIVRRRDKDERYQDNDNFSRLFILTNVKLNARNIETHHFLLSFFLSFLLSFVEKTFVTNSKGYIRRRNENVSPSGFIFYIEQKLEELLTRLDPPLLRMYIRTLLR